MKTYNEVKTSELRRLKEVSIKFQKNLDDAINKNDQYHIKHYSEKVEEMKKQIENIDEVTKACIGCSTNSFLSTLELYADRKLNLYYNHTDEFLDHILGYNNSHAEEYHKSGIYRIANFLEITKEDLECIRGKNPASDETQDIFRTYVNNKLGTNIPLSNDMKMIEIYESEYPHDREEYKHYAELLRDSGMSYSAGRATLVEDRLKGFDKRHAKLDQMNQTTNAK